RGWSIECRINAENPYENFMPSPGKIESYSVPSSIGVRVDSGVEAGSNVPTYYDPLFAKVVVWADSRGAAIRRMRHALAEVKIGGIQTNIPFHLELLGNERFEKGDTDTGLVEESGIIERLRTEGEKKALDERLTAAAVAAFLFELPGEVRYFSQRMLNVTEFWRLSPWARAGRLEQLRKRLNADEIQF
ncbi:MAG: hypothetical protein ACE5IJ_05035, partial [Thermoplasmata archaeon]